MTSSTAQRLRVVVTNLALAGLVLTGCAPGTSSPEPTRELLPSPVSSGGVGGAPSFAQLEERFDARLGVHAVDTGTGTQVSWREDERFAYASTVKAIAAGALLDEVGVDGLSTTVQVDAADIVDHSPVTETRTAGP